MYMCGVGAGAMHQMNNCNDFIDLRIRFSEEMERFIESVECPSSPIKLNSRME
jgi:hypothetical protein